ncbi:LNS2-domain-containing protein [Agrocybe pediades]|nr:LNS2-domain-containing protein [Agrocybe pediades]
MNYIRGAVNAISAPYQYYKDLPPINPSTLTGAIDVIVIRRPTEDGKTELVCSPFHVRFGKWQVLRPGEKKVNVFVNGNPIPFNMKIGEAGEAFFVFETDEDVPEDLITSPIIQPTIIDGTTKKDGATDPVDTDRFGAKQEEEGSSRPTEADLHSDADTRVEPDFLDLDGGKQVEDANDDVRTTPKQTFHVPQSLRKSGSRATINQQSAHSLPSPPPSRSHSKERVNDPVLNEQDKRVDETLIALRAQAHVPEVEYHHDVTLDMEGYKSGYHDRERSDQTVRSSSPSRHDSNENIKYPTESSSHSSHLPANHQLLFPESQSAIHSPYGASRSPSESPTSSQAPSPNVLAPHPHPFRATSEPPPDIDSDGDTVPPLSISTKRLISPESNADLQLPVQEYSWEWGAFPQPSPMKATFGKGGRPEPPHKSMYGSGTVGSKSGKGFVDRKGRPVALPATMESNIKAVDELVDTNQTERLSALHGQSGRSRSIPPNFLHSHQGRRRETRGYKEYEDLEDEIDSEEEEERGRGGHPQSNHLKTPSQELLREPDGATFGSGGILSPSKDDPTTFILEIESRKIAFQLSLISNETSRAADVKRQNEFEAGQFFDRYRVDWNRFIKDDSVVSDPRLVIRWGTDQYITRDDGSPLMHALTDWRSAAIKKQASGEEVRPVSPSPVSPESAERNFDDEKMTWELPEQKMHGRSKSEPPSDAEKQTAEAADKALELSSSTESPPSIAKKPTSSSWVQWWSRSRRTEEKKEGQSQPTENHSVSSVAFPSSDAPTTPVPRNAELPRSASDSKQEITPTRSNTMDKTPKRTKRYAKTLRLTSEQLSSLNLKAGANAITFSLSASGAVAATARIFVWDSTDLVVISDIDGTITKSDGLGHVFAMIGRDWTHVGVAKLYTDIVRNGYKIMYLTSRAIGQADATRDYLKGIKQNNYQLPEGPVIMSPDRLMASLHREVIMRKPEVFKMACLRDIQRLFGESARNPFYAGFGNRITDALSYRSVNVPSARIFTIDSSGEVKMELLELAGYKSSYIHMTDLVDQMFPPIHRKWAPEYTDFNYWKTPVQDFPLPDLSPPSPALSARSDTSNQSTLARLRNFSLGGSANSTPRRPGIPQNLNDEKDGESYRSSHLRQMSSFEKLSSTLGFIGEAYRRSASPDSSYLGSDDEDDDALGPDGQTRKKVRRRSMTSMPGTLDEMHFGMDDDEEDEPHFTPSSVDSYGRGQGNEGDEYDGEEEERDDPEEEADEAFDDDLLATGEMQKVPFL